MKKETGAENEVMFCLWDYNKHICVQMQFTLVHMCAHTHNSIHQSLQDDLERGFELWITLTIY
jgi:hypothetical protein